MAPKGKQLMTEFYGDPSIRHRRVAWRLHPVLTEVLNRLEGTAIGQALKDRAVELSTFAVLSDPIDIDAALAAHRWVLAHADGDGVPLTAAGYLKPADVRALAAVMPQMRGRIHKMTREIDAHPVLHFREYLKEVGLIRKYKGTLRITRLGRDALADSGRLWQHLADTLLIDGTDFDAQASVVILVHAATTEGGIDVDAVARTITALGWTHRDDSPVQDSEVCPIWNELWTALGNVGDVAELPEGRNWDRELSTAARVLVSNALFTEV
jgi:hypothetical protein